MKKLLIVCVAVAFEATFVCSNALGFEAYGQDEEEPNQSAVAIEDLIVVGIEGVAALGVGTVAGYGAFIMTCCGLSVVAAPRSYYPEDQWPILIAGLAVGYGLGFPLGSALGTSLVGGITHQGGSFGRSWAGAELGALAALSLALATGGGAGPLLVLGPPAGAVMGYNLSRPKGTQASNTSIGNLSGVAGPQLSLLVPEVELRQDRISNSIREPVKGSPTLTYKLTLARFTF